MQSRGAMLRAVGRRAASALSGAAAGSVPVPCSRARSSWGASGPAVGPEVGARLIHPAGSRRILGASGARKGQGGGTRWQNTRADGEKGNGYSWWGNVPLSWSMAAASAVAGASGIVLCKAVELPKGIITIDDVKEFFEVGDMLGEGGFAAVYRAVGVYPAMPV